MAFLWNPDNPSTVVYFEEVQTAVRALGLHLLSLEARSLNELASAFAKMAKERPGAFLMTGDAVHQQHIQSIIDFMAKHRLPAMYHTKEAVRAGGLMSYGASQPDLLRRGALYVHKILQGANPAELPVEQPTKFELIINLKIARTLGLDLAPTVLARADEVIE
jgi:putative ABC transport system substrate-binding protein